MKRLRVAERLGPSLHHHGPDPGHPQLTGQHQPHRATADHQYVDIHGGHRFAAGSVQAPDRNQAGPQIRVAVEDRQGDAS